MVSFPARRPLIAPALAVAAALAGSSCDSDRDSGRHPQPAAASSGRPAPSPSSDRPSAAPPAAVGTSAPASPPTPPTLPRGGTAIFPRNLVVLFYGTAGSGALGVLGEQEPAAAARRLERAAKPFGSASGRPVLPAFELITTVASASSGADGDYSSELDPEQVQPYLDVARARRLLLVLDFQPGRADFLDQVRRYQRFLVQPEVGVGLDPEWKLTSSQLPLHQVGRSAAAPINAVSAYLSDLVRRHHLPEKLFLVHQFRRDELPDRSAIADRPGLATVLHVDGFGPRGAKLATYATLASRDRHFVNGFKLFYDEDDNLFAPRDVMAIRPRPQLVSYQ